MSASSAANFAGDSADDRACKIRRLSTDVELEPVQDSPELLANWPSELPKIQEALLAKYGCTSELQQNLSRGTLYVTSSYSGMGTFEHVLRRLASAALPLHCTAGPQPEASHGPLVFWSCHETDKNCRAMLMQSGLRPKHMFGDIQEQLDPDAVNKMKFVIKTLSERLNEFEARCQREETVASRAKQLIKEETDKLNMRCMQKLQQICSKEFVAGSDRREGWCFVCQQHCPYDPPMTGLDSRLELGGNSCISFSPQGSRMRWLHFQSVPCAIWMSRSEHRNIDFLVQECSHCFNTESCMECFFSPANGWQSHVVTLSPVDVSVPMTRPRKFSFTTSKKFTVKVPLTRELIMAVCGGKATVDAHDFWCMSPEVLQQVLSLQAQRHSKDELDTAAELGVAALTPGCQKRLKDYDKHIAEVEAKSNNAKIIPVLDLSQNVRVRQSLSSVMPSPLCGSVIFSCKHRRQLQPGELFFALGWPYPGLSGTCDDDFPFPAEVLEAMSERQIYSMLGNSVHCRVTGFFFAVAFMLAERRADAT